MNPIKIKDDVYWVGGIDWDLRNFHGYLTQEGSTYNAYLVMDEKITLIDTVKHYLYDEMIERISKVVDPAKIDCIISNHVEMDHSGSLPFIKETAPGAKIVTSVQGEKGLRAHYKKDWDFTVVKTGDSLNIGKRTLQFVLTPMVHWPDNMVTYSPYDKILFSNDAFGQHIASPERFDDHDVENLIREAKKYFANIVLPYADQVKKALDDAAALDIGIIAPSHGIIWRDNIGPLIRNYRKWCANETENRALIIYDTMWNSTEKIARAIQRAFENKGVPAVMLNLKSNHISDIMTEVLTARYICVGSPTLNKNMLPTVSAFLTYMKGLAPKGRLGLAFGSYGWAGGGVDDVEEVMKASKIEVLDKIKVQYIPNRDDLEQITQKVEGLIRG